MTTIRSKSVNIASFVRRTTCAFSTPQRQSLQQKKISIHSPISPFSFFGDHRNRVTSLSSARLSTTSYDSNDQSQDDNLLHPSQFNNGIIPLPKALSPSSAAEFRACPQSYLFKYLYGIKEKPNKALAKGSICHSALEQVFDLHPRDRTLQHLQNLFRKNWSNERNSEKYLHLFACDDDSNPDGEEAWDLEAEREWGRESMALLENYFELEDPSLVPRPNPIEREMWVRAELSVDPSQGITARNSNYGDQLEGTETFLVRGIVDRLDFVAKPSTPRSTFLKEVTESNNRGVIRIIDYKTGKAPDLKYSPVMNDKIVADSTWQLKIYALLLREMLSKGQNEDGSNSLKSKGGNLKHLNASDFRLLRLMYLTNKDAIGQFLDMDLGETQDERDEVLNEVHSDLASIWKSIVTLVNSQDPTQFHHCDRSFCDCHKVRARFVPGSVSDEIHVR